MKRPYIALVVASLFTASAYAETSITLYGVVDEAITVSKVRGEDAVVGLNDGIWAGPRFGFKGNEDLGAGWSIGFILEQGFSVTTGNAMDSSKAFARQSTFSVTGPFGHVAIGRTGGLSSDCGTYTILHGSSLWTSYYNNGNIYGTFILSARFDNMVVYKTPNYKGSTVTLMYSNGLGANSDDQKWSKNDHYYGVGYEYVEGPALFSAMWEMYDNKESGYKTSNIFTIGGSYDFGFMTVYGAYQYANKASRLADYVRLASMGEDGADQNSFSASVGFPVMGGTLKFQGNLGFGKIKHADHDQYNLWSFATAYEYPISKRTWICSYAGYGRGNKAVAKIGNYNSWTISTGINHSF